MRHRRLLCVLLVFTLAFSVRLAYIFLKQIYLEPGAAEMERAAASLADHGLLGNVYAADSGPSAHVAPLYPLFLSLIYRLFGSGGGAGRLAQELAAIGISSLAIALLPVIARRSKLATGSGWIAATVLAILPLNLWVETSGAWEQPSAALLLLFLFWTVLVLRDRHWQPWWLV